MLQPAIFGSLFKDQRYARSKTPVNPSIGPAPLPALPPRLTFGTAEAASFEVSAKL